MAAITFSAESLAPATPNTRSIKTFLTPIEEGATSTYSITLLTSVGGAILNTQIDSITLTLIDEETHVVLNTRENQDVLGVGKTGQNNVTVSGTADIVWSMQAADNTYVDPTQTKRLEFHRALFTIQTNPHSRR
jgi:hypothetical protein